MFSFKLKKVIRKYFKYLSHTEDIPFYNKIENAIQKIY